MSVFFDEQDNLLLEHILVSGDQSVEGLGTTTTT